MKGWVLKDKDQALIYENVADPELSAGEALVKIHAAALNHRDIQSFLVLMAQE